MAQGGKLLCNRTLWWQRSRAPWHPAVRTVVLNDLAMADGIDLLDHRELRPLAGRSFAGAFQLASELPDDVFRLDLERV
jgi:hypothetical protein